MSEPEGFRGTKGLYAERDIESDWLMHHYAKHVCAMTAEGLHGKGDIAAELAYRDAIAKDLLAALQGMVNAKALKDVRGLVAGWNGEHRPEGPHASRHPDNLGATLPKTNCGAVYALDEAMEQARAAIAKALPQEGSDG